LRIREMPYANSGNICDAARAGAARFDLRHSAHSRDGPEKISSPQSATLIVLQHHLYR
jgi:hypothetical protein